MSEEEVFKSRSKLPRSPTPDSSGEKPKESGYLSDFINLSKNLSQLQLNENQPDNITIKSNANRRSVSFNLPSSSSTFYAPQDDSLNQTILRNQLLELDETLSVPNQIDTSHSGFTLLDQFSVQHFYPEFSSLEVSLRQVPSLKSLAEEVCVRHGLICQGGNTTQNTIVEDILIVVDGAESLEQQHLKANQTNVRKSSGVKLNESVGNTAESEKDSKNESNKNTTESEQSDQNKFRSDNNTDFNLNNLTPEAEEMALTIPAILSGVEKFTSKSREQIESFIASAILYNELASEDRDLKAVVLKTVRSRLAAVTKLGNVKNLTFDQIIARIREKFQIDISFDAAQEKLISIQQGKNESIDDYGERIKKLVDIMNAACMNDNEAVQNAQVDMNEKLAIRKFKQNLQDKNLRLLTLSSTHNNLFEAISFAVEKHGEINTTNVKTNAVANEAPPKAKKYCNICKRKSHNTKDCYSNKGNQQNGESSEKSQNSEQSQTRTFKGKSNGGKSTRRSMKQASGNVQSDDGSDEDAPEPFCREDGQQQLPLRSYRAHLNC